GRAPPAHGRRSQPGGGGGRPGQETHRREGPPAPGAGGPEPQDLQGGRIPVNRPDDFLTDMSGRGEYLDPALEERLRGVKWALVEAPRPEVAETHLATMARTARLLAPPPAPPAPTRAPVRGSVL